MARRSNWGAKLGFFVCALVICVLGLVISPGRALAADQVAYSQDEAGNKTYYASTGDALSAGFSGKTIVMTADWDMSDPIKVEKSQKLTIEMNGHVLRRTTFDTPWYSQYTDRHAAVFHLYENAELTLTGNLQSETEYTYEGYSISDDRKTQTTVSGGFITSGDAGTRYGGFWLEDDGGKVTLENVAAVGMNGMHPGFCIEGKNCTVNLKNAKIEHNKSTYDGGAITVYGKYATINMDASHMDYNASTKCGGAVYSNAGGTTINMINSSTIDHNYSFSEGGALYFAESYFHVVSSDKTGSISNNGMWIEDDHEDGKDDYAHGGGAIATHTVVFGTNEASIEGITINKNRSNRRAAGLMLRSEYITVKDCTITNNIAKAVGGAAVVLNDHIVFDNCTVTGNVSEIRGGGIVVESNFDVRLSGVTTITGNTSGSNGTKDDLLLMSSPEDSFAAAAYTLGNVAPGSKIGLAFNCDFNRKVGMNMSNYVEGAYFLDDDEGWHLSYSAADKELWRIKGEADYSVTINGNGTNRYKKGTNVIANGLTSDKSKVFMYWSTTGTTGLQPVENYITDPYSPILSFTTPANNVNLVAIYGSKISVASLYVTTPVAGQKFPTTGKLSWLNTLGTISKADIPLAWYEVGDGGKLTAVSGKAKAGKSYVAYAIAREDSGTTIPVFDPSLTSKALAQYVDNVQTGNVAGASVDAKTGTLTLVTTPIAVGGEKSDEGEKGTVVVKLQGEGLPVAADEGEAAPVVAAIASLGDEAMALDGDVQYGGASVDGDTQTLVVTYTKGDDVTVVAPELEGYNFNHWEKVPVGYEYDDQLGTVAIADADADNIDLLAVYVPVVTEINLDLAAPVTGQELSSSVSKLELTGSNGVTYDLARELGDADGKLAVTWSPEGEDAADYLTSYTACIDLGAAKDTDGELVDVDKVFASNVVVKLGGVENSDVVAGMYVADDELYLCVTFPATGKLALVDVPELGTYEMTYEDAYAAQVAQESHEDGENHWKLPNAVLVTLNDGEQYQLEVEWNVPTGFDKDNKAAQEFVATGRLVLPSFIDAGDVLCDVKMTVKVAAAQADDTTPDDKDDDKGDNVVPDDKRAGDTTTTTTTKTTKKGIPNTGDATWGGVAGLLAAAVVALGVALRTCKE